MKRLIWVLLGLTIAWDVASGAEINLKAMWVPNAESDMREYRLYRTDSGKTLIGVIPHPGSSINFSVTVPRNNSKDLTFVLTAVDQYENESSDSNISTVDVTPPSAPKGVKRK